MADPWDLTDAGIQAWLGKSSGYKYFHAGHAVGSRGNTARFQAELREMFQEYLGATVPINILDLLFDVRQQAEDNTRARLGHAPGGVTAADHWWVAPSPHIAMKTENPMPGGEEASLAALQNWKMGEKLAIFNNVYYLYFHEVGYNSHSGGARPKNILRDAVALKDGTEEVI